MAKFKLNREQKIGIFSIIILVSIYMIINYLKGKDLFSNMNTFYAEFYDVEGITATVPIHLRGHKIGTIESVDYNPAKNSFLLKLKVQSAYKIPNNSVAEIYDVGILGTRALRINLGDSQNLLKNRDTLQSSINPGMIDGLLSELLPLKDDIQNLIKAINLTFDEVNQIISPELKKEIDNSINNLNKTLKSASEIMSNLNKSSPEITEIVTNFNKITSSLDETSHKLNSGLDNINEITESIKSSDLAGTINTLKDLLSKLHDPDGSIGKLINTDSIHNSIEVLINDLDSLIKNINENPKKYIKVSVF